MALKTADTRPAKPEDQELALKLRRASHARSGACRSRAALGQSACGTRRAFERQYLHFVGSRYAELDEWKAQIAERLVTEQPGNERALHAAREARARAGETKSVAGEKSEHEPRAFHASPEMKSLYREVAQPRPSRSHLGPRRPRQAPAIDGRSQPGV